jgi:DNA repair protein RecN (Recombination protein N)
MMGGDPDSEAGLAHASDLVDQTAAARANRSTTKPSTSASTRGTSRATRRSAPSAPAERLPAR